MSELLDIGRLFLTGAWCDALTQALDIPAVRMRQRDAPLPRAQSFATVQLMDLGTKGHPDIAYTNNAPDLTETISEALVYVASINFFRTFEAPPVDLARNFRLWLYTANGKQFFRSRQIGVGFISDARDLSHVERGQWEDRTQVDIQFSVKAEYIDSVLSIASAAVAGALQADGTTYTIEG